MCFSVTPEGGSAILQSKDNKYPSGLQEKSQKKAPKSGRTGKEHRRDMQWKLSSNPIQIYSKEATNASIFSRLNNLWTAVIFTVAYLVY